MGGLCLGQASEEKSQCIPDWGKRSGQKKEICLPVHDVVGILRSEEWDFIAKQRIWFDYCPIERA